MPSGYMIYNPIAGRYPSRILTERAANLLREEGWDIHLEQSRSSDHLAQLARYAVAGSADVVFIVGGDGSINIALSSLMNTNTALGVLPAGTANVWAQELGLPGLTWTRMMALEESARLLAHGQIRNIDIGLCNDRPFLLWSGIGLDAFIVHRIEPRQLWEKHFAVVHYTASAIWNASQWRGIDLEVEVNGQTIGDRYLLAVINNVHLYAGGYARLSPNALMDDGQMDLWLFKGETLGDTVQRVFELLAGNHEKSDQVILVPFNSLVLKSTSNLYVQVDGEPVETIQPLHIRVIPRALKVLTPLHTPHPLFGSTEVTSTTAI
jgi:diacylglycerol kinase (ATP)